MPTMTPAVLRGCPLGCNGRSREAAHASNVLDRIPTHLGHFPPVSWTCLVVRHALAAPMAEATTPAERCAALKLRAAGKKAKGKAACYAASVARHSDPNGCIARIEPRFSSAWAR